MSEDFNILWSILVAVLAGLTVILLAASCETNTNRWNFADCVAKNGSVSYTDKNKIICTIPGEKH